MRVQFLKNYAGPEGRFHPAHSGDAGIDLYAAGDHWIYPGEHHVVECGVRIALPEGMEGQIRPKSGLSANFGLTILNTPGTIDEGYRGEIKVILYNANPVIQIADLLDYGDKILDYAASLAHSRAVHIKRGQKIAQLVIAKYERPDIHIVANLDDETSRGSGGFGSTGLGISVKMEVDL